MIYFSNSLFGILLCISEMWERMAIQSRPQFYSILFYSIPFYKCVYVFLCCVVGLCVWWRMRHIHPIYSGNSNKKTSRLRLWKKRVHKHLRNIEPFETWNKVIKNKVLLYHEILRYSKTHMNKQNKINEINFSSVQNAHGWTNNGQCTNIHEATG